LQAAGGNSQFQFFLGHVRISFSYI
jgi:hypothetical protein